MKALCKPLLAALLLWLGSTQSGIADQGLWGPERNVVINGQLITGQDLLLLDTLNGGFTPPGRYWLNPETGAWGYEGGPQQGVVGGEGGGTEGGGSGGVDNRSYDEIRDDFCVQNPGVC